MFIRDYYSSVRLTIVQPFLRGMFRTSKYPLTPSGLKFFSVFLSVKMINWVHLFNKSRKIQCILHGFFNAIYATNRELGLSKASNIDPCQITI